jgi:hypothetical protein
MKTFYNSALKSTKMLTKSAFFQPTYFVLFLSLSLFSCGSIDIFSSKCKLEKIDRGNGNVHTYSYDSKGKITQMKREYDGTGLGNTSTYVYTMSYNADGLLSKSSWTLNSIQNGVETYEYLNNQVSKATFEYTDGTKGVNKLKYNAEGRLVEAITEIAGSPESDSKQYFEYNSAGILIKRGYADLKGNVFFEARETIVGSLKHPESLLIKAGLPYDILSGLPWQTTTGGIGSESDVFFPNDDGKLVSDGISKTTAFTINKKKYLTSISDDYSPKPQVFTMIECK